MPTDDLLSISEAVQHFDVSASTLRRLWRDGMLLGAHMRPGRFGDEIAVPTATLEAQFQRRFALASPPSDGGSQELRRLIGLLEAEQAGREREVADLRARLERAERERDEALERLRSLTGHEGA